MLPPETVSTTYPTLPRRHPREVTMHVAPAAIARCCIITTRGSGCRRRWFLTSLRSSRIAHKLAPLLRSWRNRDQALLAGSARTLVRSGGGGRAPSAAGSANHLRTRDQLAERRPGGGGHGHGRRDTNDSRDERQGRVLVIRAGWGDHPLVPECRLQAPHGARGRGPEPGRRDPRAGRLQPRGGRDHGPGHQRRETLCAERRWDGWGGRGGARPPSPRWGRPPRGGSRRPEPAKKRKRERRQKPPPTKTAEDTTRTPTQPQNRMTPLL